MTELEKLKMYREKIAGQPMTSDTFVLSELVETKVSNNKLRKDNEKLRDDLDEKEHLLDVIAKVLIPFGLHFDGESYFQVDHSYLALRGGDSGFTADEARAVLDFLTLRMPTPAEEEPQSPEE